MAIPYGCFGPIGSKFRLRFNQSETRSSGKSVRQSAERIQMMRPSQYPYYMGHILAAIRVFLKITCQKIAHLVLNGGSNRLSAPFYSQRLAGVNFGAFSKVSKCLNVHFFFSFFSGQAASESLWPQVAASGSFEGFGEF